MKHSLFPLPLRAWPIPCAAALAAGFLAGSHWHRAPASVQMRGKAPPAAMLVSASARTATAARTELLDSLALLNAGERTERLRELAREVSVSDPAAAWAMQRDIAGTTDRENYTLAVLEQWSTQDPWGAVHAAATLPAGRLRTACTATALAGLAETDAAAALEFASTQLTGAARESALTGVVQAWAGQDAAAAAQWARENVFTPGASGALRAAVQTWTDTDPAAASQWVAGLPPGTQADGAVSALVQKWAEQTPAEAAAWVSSRGAKPALEAPSAALAAEWAASDPRAATEWAATLPRTLTARIAAARAMGEWAAVAPQEAAAWLASNQANLQDIAPALHRSLGSGWAAQDPAAAASWVQGVPDPWLQQDSVPAVFNTWAAMDTGGLTSWLTANTASPLADAAREQLALMHSDSAPAEALAVALQVSTPQQAANLGRRILDDWQARDLAAANQWTSANPQEAQRLTRRP